MIVRERDAKHGSGKHHHDYALQFDGFFRIHNIRLGSSSRIAVWKAASRRPFAQAPAIKPIYQRLPAKERFPPLPLPGRGRASPTTNVRSLSAWPLSALIAALA